MAKTKTAPAKKTAKAPSAPKAPKAPKSPPMRGYKSC
jgi:hypothetical protein